MSFFKDIKCRGKLLMAKTFLLSLCVVILTQSIAIGTTNAATVVDESTKVGAWYLSWYAKTGTQNWSTSYGSSSANQLLGDVNGDGKADAIGFSSNGDWYVALSNGSSFSSASLWTSGHGSGSTSQFLDDVTGDGKADAVVYFSSTGAWYVATSNGSGFNSYTQWISGFGTNVKACLLADVSGDGKADAIAYSATTTTNGAWSVAKSTGTAFSTGTSWKTSFGGTTSKPLVGDVTGDGKLDAVTFLTGTWKVAPSSGTAFGTTATWKTGYGSGTTNQILGDITGDVKADAIYYNSTGGDWYYAPSSGSAFGTTTAKFTGYSKYASGASKTLLGNVYGSNYAQCVAFFSGTGTWQVRGDLFNTINTWEAWNIKYTPYTLGQYQTYDSGNTDVIDEHLAMLASAGIDFIVLDSTNNLYVDNGYIYYRAKAIAARINVWNSNPNNRNIKYCLAVGGIQWSNDPATIEYEAGEVYNQFVNTVDGGTTNYYYLNGKPALINYCLPSQETLWVNYTGSKANTNQFTMKWAHSPAEAGNYGWECRTGSISDNEVMLVMPGWNNNKGAPTTSRANGDFYSLSCWERVLAKNPRPQMVVINSFNEYAEETAVAPTDTTNVVTPTEKWLNKSGVQDNFMYWNMTKEYIRKLKGFYGDTSKSSLDFSSTQGTKNWYYQQLSGSTYSNMTYNSSLGYWVGAQASCIVAGDWMHPDTNDAVRKWVAPNSGTISISGNVKKGDISGGDGVSVKINKNSTTIWGATDIAYNNSTGVSYNFTTTVSTGDAIYFIVNKKTNNSYDTTIWNPVIAYDRSYVASTQFSGTQGNNQWYYQGKVGITYTDMTYNSTYSIWTGPDIYNTVANIWMRPSATADAVRKWVSPLTGTVLLSGIAKKLEAELAGDGVTLTIRKNSTVIWSSDLAGTNKTGVAYCFTTSVTAGDNIYFELNKKITIDNDGIYWDQCIYY